MSNEFLIEIEPGEQTRFVLSEAELREYLQVHIAGFFKVWTTGPVPAVRVTPMDKIGSQGRVYCKPA